jgi:hypothetical protein
MTAQPHYARRTAKLAGGQITMQTRGPSKHRFIFSVMLMLVPVMLLNLLQFMRQPRRTPFVNFIYISRNRSKSDGSARSTHGPIDTSILQDEAELNEMVSLVMSDSSHQRMMDIGTYIHHPKYYPVTYASHRGSDERFCMSLESAARHRIPLTILGWGVPWQGLFQKLEAAMNLTAALPPEDVVLFVDAFDVFFTNASSQVHLFPGRIDSACARASNEFLLVATYS